MALVAQDNPLGGAVKAAAQQVATPVELTQDVYISGKLMLAGDVIHVPAGLAAELIYTNRAVRYVAPPAQPEPQAQAELTVDTPVTPKPQKAKS
jgi:hypothetical protein